MRSGCWNWPSGIIWYDLISGFGHANYPTGAPHPPITPALACPFFFSGLDMNDMLAPGESGILQHITPDGFRGAKEKQEDYPYLNALNGSVADVLMIIQPGDIIRVLATGEDVAISYLGYKIRTCYGSELVIARHQIRRLDNPDQEDGRIEYRKLENVG